MYFDNSTETPMPKVELLFEDENYVNSIIEIKNNLF